jgi:glycosyltransferase involved in cell wall biosynthesis
MKIVVPFLIYDGNKLDAKSVYGGIERFIQLIYRHANAEVVPFYYTTKERDARVVTKQLAAFIHNEQPDIVIVNLDSATLTVNLQKIIDVPILYITHSASGGIFKIPQMEFMQKFVDNGGTMAMVSQWQFKGMDEMSKRVLGRPFTLNGGFINSAFCSGLEQPTNNIARDVITIGRMDACKKPFLLHKCAGSSNLNTLVITAVGQELSPSNQKYYESNQHWQAPRHVLYNLPHVEVLKHLSESGAYFSTCARETWGITALEAFSHGVPVILLNNAENKYEHASQAIAPSSEFYATIGSIKTEEFVLAVDKLRNIDRLALSQMTKEKHSKDLWIKNLHNLIDKTIEIYKGNKKPVNLFTI